MSRPKPQSRLNPWSAWLLSQTALACGTPESRPATVTSSHPVASSAEVTPSRVDPLEIFERLVGVVQPSDLSEPAALEARKRVQREESVLDAVPENAERTRARLGTSDQRRMDEFLESVRAVERRATGLSAGMGGLACSTRIGPVMPRVEQSALAPRQTTENYDKGQHADTVDDLIVMAFECDVTRVISYMLEDERSEFIYDHVAERTFTEDTSTPKGGPCPEYHLAQLGLQTDQHLVLEERPLRDLYVTLLRDVYGTDVADFGQHVGGAPPATIAELLKS